MAFSGNGHRKHAWKLFCLLSLYLSVKFLYLKGKWTYESMKYKYDVNIVNKYKL